MVTRSSPVSVLTASAAARSNGRANEHRELLEGALLFGGEQVVGPLRRGPKAAVPLGAGAVSSVEEPEAVVQPVEELARCQAHGGDADDASSGGTRMICSSGTPNRSREVASTRVSPPFSATMRANTTPPDDVFAVVQHEQARSCTQGRRDGVGQRDPVAAGDPECLGGRPGYVLGVGDRGELDEPDPTSIVGL